MAINSTSAYKNASLHFSIDLYIHYKWWFQGGYITVKNLNLIGSPTIFTYGPLENYYPGTDPSKLSIDFPYQIPSFLSIGQSRFQAFYTGSSSSQTLPCSSDISSVTILSSGFSLVQSVNSTTVQRSEEGVNITSTVLGDNPNGLNLQVYFVLESEQYIISEEVLTSRTSVTIFFPNNSYSLGELVIYTELIDEFDTIYCNTSVVIIIQDRIHILYELNSSDYRHGEIIHLEVYITEDDILTAPVDCSVELIDYTDGNRSIITKSTNADGFVFFNYQLPMNTSVGDHHFLLHVYNTNEYLLDGEATIIVPIKGLIEIDVTYEAGGIIRNTLTQIQTTVLSGGVALNEGVISLRYGNFTLIESKDCVAGLIFDYFITNDYPLGSTELAIHFSSPNYDEGYKFFELSIFSTPHIESLGQNTSEVVTGQSARLWGYLKDEIGKPLYYQDLSVIDKTTDEILGLVTTDDKGLFFYDMTITDSMQIGVHHIEFQYDGDFSEYYNPILLPAVISINVHPPLSVRFDDPIIANFWTNIVVEGGIHSNVSLSWQKDGESSWEFIGFIHLNTSGVGVCNWTTPYYKGGFSIKASNHNSVKYGHSSMYSIPAIEVLGLEIGDVNTPYNFLVDCSERYQILLEDQVWQDWTSGGIHDYKIIFNSRGIKELRIVTNDSYVIPRVYQHTVIIYEGILISLSVPSEVQQNIEVNIDGQVLGEVSGPISGLDALLVINGTEVQIDSTNSAGGFYFTYSFNQPGIYTINVKTALVSSNYFNISTSNLSTIRIVPLSNATTTLNPDNTSIFTSKPENTFSSSPSTNIDNNQSTMKMPISDVTTIGLGAGLFACFLMLGNTYGRKRRS
jgi:hypothetical protein